MRQHWYRIELGKFDLQKQNK